MSVLLSILFGIAGSFVGVVLVLTVYLMIIGRVRTASQATE
jgi:hypothetical protein